MIGFSIAVPVFKGVPYHQTKIPFITGLTARDLKRDAPTHHLGNTMKAYLESRGLKNAPVVYQGDAPLAHLGGVAMADIGNDDSSILLVCGNGLACADYSSFVLCGMIEMLDNFDSELYPPGQTENGQYQYLIAGKGLYGLMHRAILLRARESGSALKGFDARHHFATDIDSEKVVAIWESSLENGTLRDLAAEIREQAGEAAFSELQRLTLPIMQRGISCLVNCALSTIVHMGPSQSRHGHKIFVEGSIALNQWIYPLIENEILARSGNRSVYERLKVEAPAPPELLRDVRKYRAAPGVSEQEASKVELTLTGAASMIIAEDCLGKLSVTNIIKEGMMNHEQTYS